MVRYLVRLEEMNYFYEPFTSKCKWLIVELGNNSVGIFEFEKIPTKQDFANAVPVQEINWKFLRKSKLNAEFTSEFLRQLIQKGTRY